MPRFFKFIDIYYLINKMLDNIVIFMIPGLPLWVDIHYDFGDDFSQQFPGMIAGMALRFFLNTMAFQLLLRPSPNSGPFWAPLGPLISATSEPLSFAFWGPLMTWVSNLALDGQGRHRYNVAKRSR